jgi:septal ring factor EnvC (AmiA/AmiB activator)
VVDEFRAPTCTWCAGNRGIEYVDSPGSAVSAVVDGTVTFAGRVAGVSYVVVRSTRGVLVTHGKLGTIVVRQGTTVTVGETLGQAGDALYIGVRVGGSYVDPRRCSLAGARPRPRAVLVSR